MHKIDIRKRARKSKRNQMAQRGGKRPGSGRPQGRRNKATLANKLTLEELARSYTDVALNVLVDVAQNGQSDASRVSAANAILDRGYGKPRQLGAELLPQHSNDQQSQDDVDRVTADIEELLKEFLLKPAESDTNQVTADTPFR
jgi:hypothetical protein